MSKAYQNFVEVLDQKSPYTKEVYVRCFKNFLRYIEVTNADRLIEMEAKAIEDKIKDFLSYLVNLGKGFTAQNQHLWALHSFFVCNRINLNFDWLAMFLKKDQDSAKVADKPYSKEQIASLIKIADARAKVEIGIMFSGGARIGALPAIQIEDLQYVEKYDLYAIDAYPKTTANYWIILTPQASKWISELKGKRSTGFLLTSKINAKDPITRYAIIKEIWKLTIQAKIRQVDNEKSRKNIMLDHGFRKFFRTGLEAAGVKFEYAERLTGHLTDLQRRYSKPSPLEIIESSEYTKAIPYLTIKL